MTKRCSASRPPPPHFAVARPPLLLLLLVVLPLLATPLVVAFGKDSALARTAAESDGRDHRRNDAAPGTVHLNLEDGRPISTTLPTYASWNVDSSCNRGFHHIDFANPNLVAAANGLYPSKLRFGGSGNDNLVYGLAPGSPACAGVPVDSCETPGYINPGCLNASHWESLWSLAAGSRSEFVFGVAYGLDKARRRPIRFCLPPTNQLTNQSVVAITIFDPDCSSPRPCVRTSRFSPPPTSQSVVAIRFSITPPPPHAGLRGRTRVRVERHKRAEPLAVHARARPAYLGL